MQRENAEEDTACKWACFCLWKREFMYVSDKDI